MRFLVFFILSSSVFSQNFLYKFDDTEVYRVEIKGEGNYCYQQEKPSDFIANLRCNLLLKKEKKEKDTFSLKFGARKVFASVNGMVLEDISHSETLISKLIPSVRIKIKENGEIIKTEQISEGMIDISPLLKFFPVFPRKIYKNCRWMQKIPSFNFPGLPMSSLQFWYIYRGKVKNLHQFEIFSNQFIKEKKKKQDVTVNFRGINKTEGTLLFDKEKGEIKSMEGISNLHLKIIFTMPSSPENKKKKFETLPLTLKLKIKFLLEKI